MALQLTLLADGDSTYDVSWYSYTVIFISDGGAFSDYLQSQQGGKFYCQLTPTFVSVQFSSVAQSPSRVRLFATP